MAITLPELPYAKDALAPHISQETVTFHYGKHHAGYVNKLNAKIEQDSTLDKPLVELIRSQSGAVYNLAAQSFNHAFYWDSIGPKGGGEPTGAALKAITEAFGSVGDFKTQFSAAAGGHFGSGWAWLVKGEGGNLEIVDTHDAGCPLSQGKTPLLTCDVWEHAYYVDYRNARAKYIEAYWNVVNWDFVAKNIAG